ncbi:hypothetical protein BTN98_16835 [Photobacterium aquimaris]|uniref:Uncharacterized protein n=1 Tax=Photobacterium aquimaris TaxID=512643 RepID=A0A2T3HVT3_9GAMM|nr:hypothetical protein AYY21_19990 [Photobacterium aquimaris]PQJ37432.1 hypothetical protein BTN98_16835 [Photobacterium aquimaris]PSU02750.1 hypothetical protein C0W81_13650 [Photobacterium aquimaris]
MILLTRRGIDIRSFRLIINFNLGDGCVFFVKNYLFFNGLIGVVGDKLIGSGVCMFMQKNDTLKN